MGGHGGGGGRSGRSGGGGGAAAETPGSGQTLEDYHDQVFNSLSAGEQNSVIDYTTSQFEGINGHLLGKNDATPEMRKTISNVDSALGKSTVNVDTVAYRGISKDGYSYMQSNGMLDKGAVFTHKNYMSTTTDRKVADTFARGAKGTKADPHNVMQVKVPKGSKGLYLGKNSNINESELLLNRGTKVRVTGSSMVSSKVNVREFGKTVTRTQWTRITEVEVVP